jgi:hypothetical protein
LGPIEIVRNDPLDDTALGRTRVLEIVGANQESAAKFVCECTDSIGARFYPWLEVGGAEPNPAKQISALIFSEFADIAAWLEARLAPKLSPH